MVWQSLLKFKVYKVTHKYWASLHFLVLKAVDMLNGLLYQLNQLKASGMHIYVEVQRLFTYYQSSRCTCPYNSCKKKRKRKYLYAVLIDDTNARISSMRFYVHKIGFWGLSFQLYLYLVALTCHMGKKQVSEEVERALTKLGQPKLTGRCDITMP